MSKYIKNTTQSTKTYVGQDIAAGAYYQIQVEEDTAWREDSTLLVDIATGDAVVAKSNDGNNDISDVNTAVNYLKEHVGLIDSEGAPLVRTRAFSNADSLRFRGEGVSGTAFKNATTNIDFKMPEDRFVTGAEFILKNHLLGDSANFEVVDKDNILGYGDGFVLDQFGKNWYFSEDEQQHGPFQVPYPALISKDLYLRVAYTSTGFTNDVNIYVNYYLHKKPTA